MSMNEFLNWVTNVKTGEKGGPGSGNFGHAGRPGKIGGSTASGDTESVVSNEAADDMVERLIGGEGGFTYHVIQKKYKVVGKDKGYAVSPYPNKKPIPVPKTPQERKVLRSAIKAFVRKNMDSLSKSEYYLGGWNDTDDGTGIYLDISIISDTPEQAEAIGRKYKQISYFDIEKGEEVKIKY